jgi:hypothetical protein
MPTDPGVLLNLRDARENEAAGAPPACVDVVVSQKLLSVTPKCIAISASNHHAIASAAPAASFSRATLPLVP